MARRVPRNMFKNRPHLLNVTSPDPLTFPVMYHYPMTFPVMVMHHYPVTLPVMHYYSLECNTDHSLDRL